MPYSADIRAAPQRTAVNMDWIIQVINDCELELEFEDDMAATVFWRELEDCINAFITEKVFGTVPEGKRKYSEYTTIGDWLSEYIDELWYCCKDEDEDGNITYEYVNGVKLSPIE